MLKYINLFTLLVICSISSLAQEITWESVKESKSVRPIEQFIFHNPQSEHFGEAVSIMDVLNKENPEKPIETENVFDVNINGGGQLLVNSDFCTSNQKLTEKVYNWLKASDKKPFEKITVALTTSDKSTVQLTKPFIYIQNSCEDLDKYQQIIIAVVNGINQYKNELSNDWFGLEMNQLKDDQSKLMKALFDDCLYMVTMSIENPAPARFSIEESVFQILD